MDSIQINGRSKKIFEIMSFAKFDSLRWRVFGFKMLKNVPHSRSLVFVPKYCSLIRIEKVYEFVQEFFLFFFLMRMDWKQKNTNKYKQMSESTSFWLFLKFWRFFGLYYSIELDPMLKSRLKWYKFFFDSLI